MKQIIWFIFIIVILAACSSQSDQTSFVRELEEDISHVHGMGYDEKGEKLLFGTHLGLRFYENDTWYETTDQLNDYMGFDVVDKGFYTSGHPERQSDLPNPIGIQRSFDGGKTLESIGFEGETDYHFLAIGYHSHDIFLYNPEANSTLDTGFHLSKDDGENWTSVDASGIEGDLFEVAIHPTNSNYIAISTTTGVYLTTDGGEQFSLLTNKSQGIGVYFNEEALFYSTYTDGAHFFKSHLESQEQEQLNLPELKEDAPLYIAQNPENNEEFTIYTVNGLFYISFDGTKTWKDFSYDGSD